jgi:nicotinate dehydrogenase large molybdopterin subunit
MTAAITMHPRLLRPSSLTEATDVLLTLGTDARAMAGGTALQLEWARGARPAPHLVEISRLPELRGVSLQNGDMVRIGAATRLADLEADAAIARRLPLLVQAIASVGAPGVRQLATVGGNVAQRNGCLVPALLALNASVEIAEHYAMSLLTLRTWLAGPPRGLIAAFLLPTPAVDRRVAHVKIGLRAAFTPSLIGIAGVVEVDAGLIASARFAAGGGATAPQCLDYAAAGVAGQRLTEIDWRLLRDALVEEIVAPSDHLRSARYRRFAAANALVAALGGEAAIAAIARSLPAQRSVPVPARPAAEIAVSRSTLAGRWRVRPDMADKVSGRFAYLTDHRRDGMLVGRVLRAGIAHARITAVETSAAEALPGVAAVITANDIRGCNGFGIIVQDQPVLCAEKVRYAGDAVAAVAAIDEETAVHALSLICVRYEPLPIVSDAETALEGGAIRVHADGNLQREMRFARGDIDAAWSHCAHVVEGTYVTPRQMHGFMETEGGYAIPQPDGSLLICCGGQHAFRDRMQLARILAMPEAQIRVVTSPTGGAFGGKDELTVQPVLAMLALKSGRPVRLQLDRAESVLASVKRNPMRIRMRSGCDENGRLIAQDVDLLSDGGAYASLSPSVLETALEHACGPYVVPNVRARGRLAYTNNGVCGAFRGFGANEMTYAVECQVARLAQRVGLDPIGFRRINMRRPRTRGYLGQEVAPTERLFEMLDAAAASALWQRPRGAAADPRFAIGTGMAIVHQGTGLGSVIPDEGTGRLTLMPDGRIEAAIGLDEMGQGLLASIQASVAGALGCDRDDVLPVVGDTARAPDSGSTSASRGTYVVWRAATLAGDIFSRRLREAAAGALGCAADDLTIAPGGIRDAQINSDALLITFAELAQRLSPQSPVTAACAFSFPKADYRQGNARFVFAFGAAVARVAVNRMTGEVRVLDLEQHIAAGPIVDPAGYLGQIEGGGVQGLGFTLSEDVLMQDGAPLIDNFDGYMMPSIADAPDENRVFADEKLDHDDAHGPRGVGELGIGGVTPAIAAAVADAVGVWSAVMPLRPEDLLGALANGEGGR